MVRARAGLFRLAHPLGKLEVFGPDAARFLYHMYVRTHVDARHRPAANGLF